MFLLKKISLFLFNKTKKKEIIKMKKKKLLLLEI